MPITIPTKSDNELAQDVEEAVKSLNAAMQDAHNHGLRVDVSHDHFTSDICKRWPVPFVRVELFRVLTP